MAKSATEFKVLIVDDEASERQAVEGLLKKSIRGVEFNVTGAANFEEAGEAIDNNAFHLILTDMNLGPDGPQDGFEVIRIARDSEKNKKTAIIGRSSEDQYAEGMIRCGADAFVPKDAKSEKDKLTQFKDACKAALLKANERSPEIFQNILNAAGIKAGPRPGS